MLAVSFIKVNIFYINTTPLATILFSHNIGRSLRVQACTSCKYNNKLRIVVSVFFLYVSYNLCKTILYMYIYKDSPAPRCTPVS